MNSRVATSILFILAVLVISGYVPAFADEKLPTVFEKADDKPELFTVARFVVAKDVKNREPVGVSETFPAATGKVYCYLEAAIITEGSNVECIWFYNGAKVRVSSLSLNKGSRWRTYANKTINGQKGDWKVDLRDANGKVLKSVSFKVE